MQVLKDRFAMLKSRLPKNTTDIALNTCEPSYREIAGFCASGETYINKGVKSDFVRIFKTDAMYLGFSYSFIGKTQAEWTVKVSVKTDTDGVKLFYPGPSFSIDDFKKKMDAFILSISHGESDVFSLMTTTFDIPLSKQVLSKSEKRKMRKQKG